MSRNTRGVSAKGEGSKELILRPGNQLPPHLLSMLFGVLEGTAMSIESGLGSIGMDARDWDVNEIEDQLLDRTLERCQGCDWWHESGDLTPYTDDCDLVGYCPDCRDYQ